MQAQGHRAAAETNRSPLLTRQVGRTWNRIVQVRPCQTHTPRFAGGVVSLHSRPRFNQLSHCYTNRRNAPWLHFFLFCASFLTAGVGQSGWYFSTEDDRPSLQIKLRLRPIVWPEQWQTLSLSHGNRCDWSMILCRPSFPITQEHIIISPTNV